MKNPNFLILDEPTNDLDIITLQVLEDFLEDFAGCLLLVTHDRYFMDRLVDHIFVFEGNGVVRDFNGTYSEYRAVKEFEEENAKAKLAVKNRPKQVVKEEPKEKKKLSHKEKTEYDNLEKEIADLEVQKDKLTLELHADQLTHDQLQAKAEALQKIMDAIEYKMNRWIELEEFVSNI